MRAQQTMLTGDNIPASEAIPNLHFVFFGRSYVLRAYDSGIFVPMRQRDTIYNCNRDGGLLRIEPHNGSNDNCILRRCTRSSLGHLDALQARSDDSATSKWGAHVGFEGCDQRRSRNSVCIHIDTISGLCRRAQRLAGQNQRHLGGPKSVTNLDLSLSSPFSPRLFAMASLSRILSRSM